MGCLDFVFWPWDLSHRQQKPIAFACLPLVGIFLLIGTLLAGIGYSCHNCDNVDEGRRVVGVLFMVFSFFILSWLSLGIIFAQKMKGRYSEDKRYDSSAFATTSPNSSEVTPLKLSVDPPVYTDNTEFV